MWSGCVSKPTSGTTVGRSSTSCLLFCLQQSTTAVSQTINETYRIKLVLLMKFMVNHLHEVLGVRMFLGKMYLALTKAEIIFDLNMMKCNSKKWLQFMHKDTCLFVWINMSSISDFVRGTRSQCFKDLSHGQIWGLLHRKRRGLLVMWKSAKRWDL